MEVVGRIESLWRYPVKSMRGEELDEAFVGFAGVYGDRVYAFQSSASPAGFPYFTAREQQRMLQYRPFFRRRDRMRAPVNLAAAEARGSGLTPVYAGAAERAVDVETPNGAVLAIDDARLVDEFRAGLDRTHELRLLQSDRAMTDCRPISLISTQTVRQLSEEVNLTLDKLRFRANLYIELEFGSGFGEDEFVGRSLRVGDKVTIAVLARDTRCKMITLDPQTGEASPEIMKLVARLHDGKAGIYGVVLVEGMVRRGDEITVRD